MADKVYKAPFFYIRCPSCKKSLCLTMSKSMIRYGFVCVACQTITAADEMWTLILKSRQES